MAHLGPTNSGKTYEALAFLAGQGEGVYAAPLRMLAAEAHQRLSGMAGDHKVGLLTGQERINDGAPIMCCTAEMAPASGDTLVLDEVHWAADLERGSSWSWLMAAGNFAHIRLVGADDARPLVATAFPKAEIVSNERLCPLTWAGEVRMPDLAPGTVVVAFSRKAVISLARDLEAFFPKKVTILYGALPPVARRAQIGRFLDGGAHVMVATDVIGHGINMPCATIVFAETSKFDGTRRRDLLPWEIAQIAGRAGRYGHVDEGYVRILAGVAGFDPDPELVAESLRPMVEVADGVLGWQRVERGVIGPRLGDLAIGGAKEIADAIEAWHAKAGPALKKMSWLEPEPIAPYLARLDLLSEEVNLSRVSKDDAWGWCHGPIDADDPVDGHVARLLAPFLDTGAGSSPRDRTDSGDSPRGSTDGSAGLRLGNAGRNRRRTGPGGAAAPAVGAALRSGRVWDAHPEPGLESWLALRDTSRIRSLQRAEQLARVASMLRWFALAFPRRTPVAYDEAAELEEAASARVGELLAVEIPRSRFGRCRSCGGPCAPWAPRCDGCSSAGSRRRAKRYRR